jgi:ribosomal protein S7
MNLKEKLVRKLMINGKLHISKKLVKELISKMGTWTRIEKCIKKSSPIMIVQKKAKLTIPVHIPLIRQYKYGIKWIIENSRKKSSPSILLNLISELKEIEKEQGQTIRRKIEMHKLVLASKASLEEDEAEIETSPTNYIEEKIKYREKDRRKILLSKLKHRIK